MSLFNALLALISSSTKILQSELQKAALPEPWLDRPQLHPWDIETPSKEYWNARRTLLSSLGTMIALVQNPRERILCEGMGYHHPAVQNFIAHTRIADILSGPDVNEAEGLHVTEIAQKTNTHPAKLERILRFLCMYHIFQETSPNVFANNRCSTCFKSGSPNAEVPFYWSDISFRAATAFSRNLRNSTTASSERVQDSAFSAVFGAIKPEFNNVNSGEIGDFELVGLHLDKLDSPGNDSIFPTENQNINHLECDFEHVPGYLSPTTSTSSCPSELQTASSHVLSDSPEEEDSSEEEFSPVCELTRLTIHTPDLCNSFPIESPTENTRGDEFARVRVDFEMEDKDQYSSICKRTGSLGESSSSDYSASNGIIDSGILLPPTTTEKPSTEQDHLESHQQQHAISFIPEIKHDESYIPPTTILAKEPELSSSNEEVTTAFSFLSYPQCGLYRRAFAQGMFTLEIMNGALGYRDINWSQWDKEGNVFVELGASTGHLSLSVLPCLNHARFINQDLSEVCQEGVKFFLEKNPEALSSERITFQPHDFFTAQPVKGAAVYILSNILHDWPDKEALNILGNIAEAMTSESRLLVCEIVHTSAISQSLKPPIHDAVEEITKDEDESGMNVSFNEAPWPLLKDYGIVNRYSHHQTIELMVLFNGLDRTLTEYLHLFRQSNLELVKLHQIRKLVSVMELKLKD